MRVQYHPAIEGELREIIEFYNQSVEGLGVEFLEEFERQIHAISENPVQWIEAEHVAIEVCRGEEVQNSGQAGCL